MSSGIIDSCILIDCLRGRIDAVNFLAAESAGSSPVTHLLVAAELFTGARDKREHRAIESFLASFTILAPNESDALAALDLYKRFRLSHGVDWPDCQIAATALRHGMAVHTGNIKHFAAFPGLCAVRAY